MLKNLIMILGYILAIPFVAIILILAIPILLPLVAIGIIGGICCLIAILVCKILDLPSPFKDEQ